jgi:hypothetical protein
MPQKQWKGNIHSPTTCCFFSHFIKQVVNSLPLFIELDDISLLLSTSFGLN